MTRTVALLVAVALCQPWAVSAADQTDEVVAQLQAETAAERMAGLRSMVDLFSTGTLDPDRLYPAYIKTLDDPDASVSAAALEFFRMLAMMPAPLGLSPEHIEQARERIVGQLDHANSKVRAMAAMACWPLPGGFPHEAQGKIVELSRDGDPFVRRDAVTAMSLVQEPSGELTARLSELLASDPHGVVRDAAARSIGELRISDEAAITALASALGENDSALRSTAAQSLYFIGPAAKETLGQLQRMAANDPNETVRKHAEQAAESVGGSAPWGQSSAPRLQPSREPSLPSPP